MKKIFIILFVFLLTGCSLYDEYKMPKSVKIETINKTYEVYSKHKLKDLIKDSNIEIKNLDEELNTKKLGKHTVTINYKYKIWNKKLDVTYDVIDSTVPTLITARLDYVINIDEDVDFCTHAKYIDNYDRNVSCSIEGDYDISKEGSYNLKYIIKDKSNNTVTEDFNLSVIDPGIVDDTFDGYEYEYDPIDEGIYEGINFSDVISAHKNDNTMIGIDVSRWQGDIDFNKVKKAGCEFVILRMAVSNGPDDEIGLDSYYKKNKTVFN